MTELDLQISYRLARYLAGDESLAEFRRWLLPVVWELAEPESDEVSQLANRIELRLAEFINGHWTEDDLRSLFARLVPSTSGIMPDFFPTVSGAQAPSVAAPVHGPTEFVHA